MTDEPAAEQPKSSPSQGDRLIPFRWPKGTSGNPTGRKKGSRSLKGLIRAVIDENEDLAREIVLDGMNRAKRGEHKYWKDIIEIVDGKEADRLAGHDGGPLERRLTDDELNARIAKDIAERAEVEDDEQKEAGDDSEDRDNA